MSIREVLLRSATKPVPLVLSNGETVYLHKLTLGELTEIQKAEKESASNIPNLANMLARFVVDENNLPIFDVSKPEDVAAMMTIQFDIAAEILKAGNKLNALNSKDNEDPKP